MRRRNTWAVLGFALGFGAPAGSLLLHLALQNDLTPGAVSSEVAAHGFHYGYMTLATPFFFACFGYFAGILYDRLAANETALRDRTQVLENESMTDDITALYNHRHILVELDKEIERARRKGRPLCGMMIDLDDFKKVNDRFGHLTGDGVLREAATLLDRSIRKIDVIGRYGGDEFLIILPESDFGGARAVAERIQRNVREHPFNTKLGELSLTVSIGVLHFGDAVRLSPALFLEKVDEAMFHAKGEGKDRVFSCELTAV